MVLGAHGMTKTPPRASWSGLPCPRLLVFEDGALCRGRVALQLFLPPPPPRQLFDPNAACSPGLRSPVAGGKAEFWCHSTTAPKAGPQAVNLTGLIPATAVEFVWHPGLASCGVGSRV